MKGGRVLDRALIEKLSSEAERGYDLSNITFIQGDSGWIVGDPLISAETAKAALDLVTQYLGARPIVAVIYSHSHIDHYGGIRGIVDEADVTSGKIPIIAPDQFTPIAVGAGDTFIAAIKQGTIDAGMTTEPTISRLLKTGDAKVLIDLRTPELTRAALGGDYPFISIYMRADWVAQNKGVVQRVVNAYVKTLKWIAAHSPAEIADKLPADYYAGDKDLYLSALTGSMPMYSPDGKMPAGAPDFILKVLQTYNKNVQGKTIDLTKTWTNEYVDAAK